MNAMKLTSGGAPAHKASMETRSKGLAGAIELVAVMAALPALAGCVTINAPDKPIVIELNINISQEVIYRLSEDAGNTIEDNPDIF